MSLVVSLSVGEGDMFFIQHDTDSFTIIDCCMSDANKVRITKLIKDFSAKKRIVRFISTHPDDDHIGGLKYLDDQMHIRNFYCVKNETTKKDESEDFKRYCELRDSPDKKFFVSKGCSRKWLNDSDETRGGAGISFSWPAVTDADYVKALAVAKDGGDPNNISPIFTYSLKDGVTIMWMGDLLSAFMESIQGKITLPKAHILFAPHHGRDSEKVPEKLLKMIDPKIIVIGEAPSKELNYYADYHTITQNSAGNIWFDCSGKKVHVHAGNDDYTVDFLDDDPSAHCAGYIGTLNL